MTNPFTNFFRLFKYETWLSPGRLFLYAVDETWPQLGAKIARAIQKRQIEQKISEIQKVGLEPYRGKTIEIYSYQQAIDEAAILTGKAFFFTGLSAVSYMAFPLLKPREKIEGLAAGGAAILTGLKGRLSVAIEQKGLTAGGAARPKNKLSEAIEQKKIEEPEKAVKEKRG